MDHSAQPIKPPPVILGLVEWNRALFEFSALSLAAPFLQFAPLGDGHPVVVIPGFLTGDRSTTILRHYLKNLGYDAFAWELGSNLGHRTTGPDGKLLLDRIMRVHESSGRKVSLIGWSLGGVMARRMAHAHPDAVRQVITLGSPFTGDPRANNPIISRLYEHMSGESLDDHGVDGRFGSVRNALPVPSTAIYSKTDGITAWQNCIDQPSASSENIEVYGSHFGLCVNPTVLLAVADRLAQPEDQWRPFDRNGWRAPFYPHNDHAG